MVDVPRGERVTSIAATEPLDWDALFGRPAELVVEIGCGSGDSLVPMAQARPETNFVAFEVFEPGAASLLGRVMRAGINNVRLVVADGAAGLEQLFAPGSLTEIWSFFADPWHKARHHKRRLINKQFAELAARRLTPGGLFRAATDWEDYATWILNVLDAEPNLESCFSGWAPRYAARPVSKYEARGLAAGRRVFDLCYRRRP